MSSKGDLGCLLRDDVLSIGHVESGAGFAGNQFFGAEGIFFQVKQVVRALGQMEEQGSWTFNISFKMLLQPKLMIK